MEKELMEKTPSLKALLLGLSKHDFVAFVASAVPLQVSLVFQW